MKDNGSGMTLPPEGLLKLDTKWGEIRSGAPFKADLPPESNGYCHVLDRHGNDVASCYSSDSASWATAIASALNTVAQALEEMEAEEEAVDAGG